MNKMCLAFALAFFCLTPAFSQMRLFSSPRDSVKFNNRKYKQEIGLGIENVLKGYLGSALVLKIRDDRAKLVPVTYSNYWRFQLSAFGSAISGLNETFNTGSGQIAILNPAYDYHHVTFLAGRERNNFSNRFNFYYGWEAGPSLTHYKFPIAYSNQSQYAYEKSWQYGLAADVFAGIKYHLTDRISLSAEAAFVLAYNFIREKFDLPDNGSQISSSWQVRHGVRYNMQYLRFITLNYHFKEY